MIPRATRLEGKPPCEPQVGPLWSLSFPHPATRHGANLTEGSWWLILGNRHPSQDKFLGSENKSNPCLNMTQSVGTGSHPKCVLSGYCLIFLGKDAQDIRCKLSDHTINFCKSYYKKWHLIKLKKKKKKVNKNDLDLNWFLLLGTLHRPIQTLPCLFHTRMHTYTNQWIDTHFNFTLIETIICYPPPPYGQNF